MVALQVLDVDSTDNISGHPRPNSFVDIILKLSMLNINSIFFFNLISESQTVCSLNDPPGSKIIMLDFPQVFILHVNIFQASRLL